MLTSLRANKLTGRMGAVKARTEQDFYLWLWNDAGEQEKELVNKIFGLQELFNDMLFKRGTKSYELTQVTVKHNSHMESEGEAVGGGLPDAIEYFGYEQFYYRVEELEEGCMGYYRASERLLCIASSYLNDEVILHEMIHLHESVFKDLPMYFHDMLYWALYLGLKEKIDKLDEIITTQAHIVKQGDICDSGGEHDILFLLKSFDLDIQKRYPLGTVFGYGLKEELKGYTYEI